jgi:hypothetical protein
MVVGWWITRYSKNQLPWMSASDKGAVGSAGALGHIHQTIEPSIPEDHIPDWSLLCMSIMTIPMITSWSNIVHAKYSPLCKILHLNGSRDGLRF